MRLIDAEALVNETIKACCQDCDKRKGIKKGKKTVVYDIGDAPCRACGIGDMIDTIEEAPTIGGWISVEDHMPKYGECVLFTGKSSFGARFCTQRGWWDGVFWHRDAGETVYSSTPVTHWMPLPEPPKEVSEDG